MYATNAVESLYNLVWSGYDQNIWFDHLSQANVLFHRQPKFGNLLSDHQNSLAMGDEKWIDT